MRLFPECNHETDQTKFNYRQLNSLYLENTGSGFGYGGAIGNGDGYGRGYGIYPYELIQYWR